MKTLKKNDDDIDKKNDDDIDKKKACSFSQLIAISFNKKWKHLSKNREQFKIFDSAPKFPTMSRKTCDECLNCLDKTRSSHIDDNDETTAEKKSKKYIFVHEEYTQ